MQTSVSEARRMIQAIIVATIVRRFDLWGLAVAQEMRREENKLRAANSQLLIPNNFRVRIESRREPQEFKPCNYPIQLSVGRPPHVVLYRSCTHKSSRTMTRHHL